jgi:ferredoxin
VKVRLDRTLCDGFGVCAKHAPDYFSLDDWGYASLTGSGTVLEGDEDAVTRALLDCPVHAIIAISQHGPSGNAKLPHHVDETGEPNLDTEDSDAISGFVR